MPASRLCQQGGDYTIQPIDGVTLARGKEDEELWLPAASEVRRFQVASQLRVARCEPGPNRLVRPE